MNKKPQLNSRGREEPIKTSPHHGLATLTVVMVLFFVMAMVAAYTNRSLIFEQRISANSFRAASAFNAADAGLEWAIAMLNGSAVNATCKPLATPTEPVSFRDTYLAHAATGLLDDGTIKLATSKVPLAPSCILGQSDWTCICPTADYPSNRLTPTTTPGAPAPVFQIKFATTSQPGAVEIRVRGCSNISNESDPNGIHACHRTTAADPAVDSFLDISAVAGLVRALPIPPIASMTAGGTVRMSDGNPIKISNTDSSTGITVHSGGSLKIDSKLGDSNKLIGPAGSGSNKNGWNSVKDGNGKLSELVSSTKPDFFQSLFGMDAATFKDQPSAHRLDCPDTCNYKDISSAATANPGRILWIDGSINLDSASPTSNSLGTIGKPIFIIATGDITISSAVKLVGFIYAENLIWNASSSGSSIIGAAVAHNNIIGNGPISIAYDAAVLQTISVGYGSYVRIPGSWHHATGL